jgi:hypothetical protein
MMGWGKVEEESSRQEKKREEKRRGTESYLNTARRKYSTNAWQMDPRISGKKIHSMQVLGVHAK